MGLCDTTILEERSLNNWTFIALNRLLCEKSINKLELSDKITLVLYETNYKISSTRIVSSNKALVPTTEKMVKEGITDMETKRNVAETDITNHREKK